MAHTFGRVQPIGANTRRICCLFQHYQVINRNVRRRISISCCMPCSSSNKEMPPPIPSESQEQERPESVETTNKFDSLPSVNELAEMMRPRITEHWTEEELRLKEKAIRDNTWSPVYRYHNLQKYFIFMRSSLYMVVISNGLFLYKVGTQLLEKGTVELLDVLPCLGLCLMCTFTHHLVKRYMARIIGVVAVDMESRKIFRIGYMTSTGGRVNVYARAGDFKSLAESNEGAIAQLSKIRWTFRPEDEYLLICKINCEILDELAAYSLFGTLKYFEAIEIETTEEEKNKIEMLIAQREEEEIVKQLEAQRRADVPE